MRAYLALGLAVFIGVPVFAGVNPMSPAPENEYVEPTTPEGRKAYKVQILEKWIAEDQATIAHPGTGKAVEVKQRVAIAKENLKINQQVLAEIKAGTDHQVYFCSQCGREYMKEGTCPHCKKTLQDVFLPGAKRPMILPRP
jgi:hypothetical protein